MTPRVLSSDSLVGTNVYNLDGQELGTIKELMLDTQNGRITYAVLSFGGFMGIGDKLFALPWSAIKIDAEQERLLLDVTKEKLEQAEGFDKDDWPDFADPSFHTRTYSHSGQKTYWQ